MRTRKLRPWLLVPLVAIASLAGCSPASPKRPNIAVIVLDTVRFDLLSAYGHDRPTTPFLDHFATTATRFTRAYSVSSWTLPAHASLAITIATWPQTDPTL